MKTFLNRIMTFSVVTAGGLIPFLEGLKWHGIPATGIVGAALTGFAAVGIQGRIAVQDSMRKKEDVSKVG